MKSKPLQVAAFAVQTVAVAEPTEPLLILIVVSPKEAERAQQWVSGATNLTTKKSIAWSSRACDAVWRKCARTRKSATVKGPEAPRLGTTSVSEHQSEPGQHGHEVGHSTRGVGVGQG